MYIDDRAIKFDGNVDKLMSDIATFTPWHEELRINNKKPTIKDFKQGKR